MEEEWIQIVAAEAKAQEAKRKDVYLCDERAHRFLNEVASNEQHGLCAWVRAKMDDAALFCINNYNQVPGWQLWDALCSSAAPRYAPNFARALGLEQDEDTLDSVLVFMLGCCRTTNPEPLPYPRDIVFVTGSEDVFHALSADRGWKSLCVLTEYYLACSTSPYYGPFRCWPIFRCTELDTQPLEVVLGPNTYYPRNTSERPKSRRFTPRIQLKDVIRSRAPEKELPSSTSGDTSQSTSRVRESPRRMHVTAPEKVMPFVPTYPKFTRLIPRTELEELCKRAGLPMHALRPPPSRKHDRAGFPPFCMPMLPGEACVGMPPTSQPDNEHVAG